MDEHTVDSKYEIVRLLGQGGMGAVYEAQHLGTGRRVALKMIVPSALESGGADVARFQREARASGAIDSQHVVQVLDTGIDPATKRPYLVMEYLSGEDLLATIQRAGPLPVAAALRIVAQACAGLERAHEKDIVHRDIKSANLFIAQREGGGLLVKILDFGIAKVRADPLAAGAGHAAAITRTGALLGSPLYMSPEQALGLKDIDARTDVYSLGVTFYEALCGVTPNHECDSLGKLVVATCRGEGVPIRLRNPSLPQDVTAIVEKALALDRNDRFQSIREMHDTIMALLPRGVSLLPAMMPSADAAGRPTAPPIVVHTTPMHPPSFGSTPSRPPSAPPPPLGTTPSASGHSLTPPPLASTGNTFAQTSPTLFHRRPGLLAGSVGALMAILLLGGLGLRVLRPPPASTDAGSAALAAIPPLPPSASPSASALASAAVDVAEPSPSQVEHPPSQNATAPVVSVAAPQSPPSPVPVRKPSTPVTAATAAPNCDPPYTFGPDGRKIWKRDCL